MPISVGLAQLLIKVRAHTEELIYGSSLPTERLWPRGATASLFHSSHSSFLLPGFLFFFNEVLSVKRTLPHPWNLVLFGFVGIIIHRKASFFLILVNGFWLLGQSTQQMSILGWWQEGKSTLSSAFIGYLLSDHWRHGSTHPSLRATNFPVALLNYLLGCCSQQFEHTRYGRQSGWYPDQSDGATWGKPVFSQTGTAQGSLSGS